MFQRGKGGNMNDICVWQERYMHVSSSISRYTYS
jgi:hypothetical protein